MVLSLAISGIKLQLSHILVISVLPPRCNLCPYVAPPWTSQKLLASDNYLPFVFQFNYFQNNFKYKTPTVHFSSVSYSNDIVGSKKAYTTAIIQNKICNLALYVLFYMKWLFWKLGRTKAYELMLFRMLNTPILPTINKRKVLKDIENSMKLSSHIFGKTINIVLHKDNKLQYKI